MAQPKLKTIRFFKVTGLCCLGRSKLLVVVEARGSQLGSDDRLYAAPALLHPASIMCRRPRGARANGTSVHSPAHRRQGVGRGAGTRRAAAAASWLAPAITGVLIPFTYAFASLLAALTTLASVKTSRRRVCRQQLSWTAAPHRKLF